MYSQEVMIKVTAALDTLPPYYASSSVAESIIGAKATELVTLDINNRELLEQLYISTATWGLEYWERDLLIPIIPADSYDVRRGRVAAKLIGQGEFNAGSIQDICDSYGVGEVGVEVDPYEVTITFITTKGDPESLPNIEIDIAELADAHLLITYVFTYPIWDEWDAWAFTWDQKDALGLTWDQMELYTQ